MWTPSPAQAECRRLLRSQPRDICGDSASSIGASHHVKRVPSSPYGYGWPDQKYIAQLDQASHLWTGGSSTSSGPAHATRQSMSRSQGARRWARSPSLAQVCFSICCSRERLSSVWRERSTCGVICRSRGKPKAKTYIICTRLRHGGVRVRTSSCHTGPP